MVTICSLSLGRICSGLSQQSWPPPAAAAAAALALASFFSSHPFIGSLQSLATNNITAVSKLSQPCCSTMRKVCVVQERRGSGGT